LKVKVLNLVTLILVIIGGLDLGINGLSNFDVLAGIFGGPAGAVTRIVYVILGLCALWQLVPFFRSFGSDEVPAERNLS
jgi:hypothetical protein